MKPIEALKSARNTYICHQVNRVRLPDFEENRFVRRHITFHGRVQKVGFRIELAQMAERLELTAVIYAVGATFFSVGVTGGINRLKDAAKVLLKRGYANPWIFFDQSILKT